MNETIRITNLEIEIAIANEGMKINISEIRGKEQPAILIQDQVIEVSPS